MKIDLESLERVAHAAGKEEPNWLPDFTHDGGWQCPGGNIVESFVVSVKPPIVLALIARIRELEATLRSAVSLAEVHDPSGFHPDWLAILEKGAVLP